MVFATRLGCPGSAEYCPPVHQVNATYWGISSLGLNNAGTHFTRDQGSFYINLSNAAPTGRRREVACHEMGHLLGLGHRDVSGDSCLGGTEQNNEPDTPDVHDYNALLNIYSHNDP